MARIADMQVQIVLEENALEVLAEVLERLRAVEVELDRLGSPSSDQRSSRLETDSVCESRLRRFDNETDDDLSPYLAAFAQAYTYEPNGGKVIDPELGKTVAILCLRASRSSCKTQETP